MDGIKVLVEFLCQDCGSQGIDYLEPVVDDHGRVEAFACSGCGAPIRCYHGVVAVATAS